MNDSHEPGQMLVVDDNRVNRLLLTRALEQNGHHVANAENGRIAMELLRSKPFDVLLLDIDMPEMNGFEVLEALLTDNNLRDIPVIMTSASDELDRVVKCIEMGAEDYLQKPYDPVLLFARINASLDKRRRSEQEAEFLRAIGELTQAAELVEQGKFDPAVLVPLAARKDALGALARVFDRVVRELQRLKATDRK